MPTAIMQAIGFGIRYNFFNNQSARLRFVKDSNDPRDNVRIDKK